ncbi:MAG: peptidyl-prolyl cis-trans isomerase [Bradymonadales bacterium]|nr:peptidyl-prolyl cis-trans isomerase [Bradymonadales bacterium]
MRPLLTILPIILPALLLLTAACHPPRLADRSSARPSTAQPSSPELLPLDQELLLVAINGEPITLASYQQRVEALSPEGQARLSSGENRRHFLQALIHLTLLAQQGSRLGLQHDPQVLQAVRRARSDAILEEQAAFEVDCSRITRSGLQQIYQRTIHRYQRPAQARATLLTAPDETTAQAAYATYTQRNDRNLEESIRLFDHLVAQAARSTGGNGPLLQEDLGFVSPTAQGGPLPPVLSDALFELDSPGQITSPIPWSPESTDTQASERRWFILLLTERRLPYSIPFEEAQESIRQTLCSALRREHRAGWLAELRDQAEIWLDPGAIQLLDDRTSSDGFSQFVRQTWLDRSPIEEWEERFSPRRESESLAAAFSWSAAGEFPVERDEEEHEK